MEEQQLLKIRHYLLRLIAESNKTLSRKINSGVIGQNRYHVGFINITLDFARSSKNEALNEIFRDINSGKSGKNLSPHNYFDIDTLYAYSKYLDRLIFEIDRYRKLNRVGTNVSDQYGRAVGKVSKWLAENANSAETGYYNPNNPIVPQYTNVGGYKKLSPLRLLSEKDFTKKGYNKIECEILLKKYIEIKHPKVKTTSFTQVTFEESVAEDTDFDNISAYDYFKSRGKRIEDEKDIEESKEYIVYNGRRYMIDSRDSYKSYPEEFPVYSIRASRDDGRTIVGTFNSDNSVYIGDVYDNENNLVFTKEESGVSEFLSHVSGQGPNHDKLVGHITKKKAKSNQPNTKVESKKSVTLDQINFDDENIM